MWQLESDLVRILLAAAGAGLLGGIAFELLLSRRGGPGFLELPAKKPSGRLWDAGFLGSMFLGAVTAIAFLLVYQPVEVINGNVTSRQYPVLELIAMSLVAGAAGSSLLGALTAAVTKATANAQLETIENGLQRLKAVAEENPPAVVPAAPNPMSEQADRLIEQTRQARF